MEIRKNTSIEVDSIFEIIIDHSWTLNDFIDVFDSVNRLYSYYYILIIAMEKYHKIGEEYNWPEKMKKLPDFIDNTFSFRQSAFRIFQNYDPSEIFIYDHTPCFKHIPKISVSKIKYGSKGSIDIIGIGKIFEILKDLLIHYFPNKEAQLDAEIKQKEVEEREQKIIQLKIENLKKLNLETEDILSILGYEATHQRRLGELINFYKIQNIGLSKINK